MDDIVTIPHLGLDTTSDDILAHTNATFSLLYIYNTILMNQLHVYFLIRESLSAARRRSPRHRPPDTQTTPPAAKVVKTLQL